MEKKLQQKIIESKIIYGDMKMGRNQKPLFHDPLSNVFLGCQEDGQKKYRLRFIIKVEAARRLPDVIRAKMPRVLRFF
jgi:hypothetical protein